MTHNTNDLIACFDVDETLVKTVDIPTPNCIKILNPYTGTVRIREPHLPHIALMHQYKAQGYFIRVWSHGGSHWSYNVCEALGILDIVDSIEAKPSKMVDDKSCEDGVGKTLFVHKD